MTTTSRHEQALDAIGRDIIAGSLSDDAPITIEQLQQRYGATRGVVRESLRVLESKGMLASRRRTGIHIQPMHHWQVTDPMVVRWRLDGPGRADQLRALTEVRLALEPVACRFAALRATQEARDRLRETVARLRVNAEAGRLERHLDADLDFHTQILEASGNEIFRSLGGMVREVLIARRRQGLIKEQQTLHAIERHERVAAAIIDADPDAAEAAMHDLLAEVRLELSAREDVDTTTEGEASTSPAI